MVPLAEASADIRFVALPDEVIPHVFRHDVAPALRPSSAIVFASGYTPVYHLVRPPTPWTCCSSRRGWAAPRRRPVPGWRRFLDVRERGGRQERSSAPAHARFG